MAMKIKDPNDPTKEIEVYTKEEIEAAKGGGTAAIEAARNAAIEEYKKNNPDKSTEVERLKNDLAQKNAELEAAIGMDGGEAGRAAQIQRLKDAKDAAEKALNTEIGGLKAQVDGLVKSQQDSAKNALLDRLVGTDKEKREKVLYEFDRYDPTGTDLEARMTKAVTLSGVTVDPAPGAMDGNGGMGGQRGNGGNQGGVVQVTQNAEKIGGALGIKPEELKAHAEKKAAEGNK